MVSSSSKSRPKSNVPVQDQVDGLEFERLGLQKYAHPSSIEPSISEEVRRPCELVLGEREVSAALVPQASRKGENRENAGVFPQRARRCVGAELSLGRKRT